MQMTMVPHTSVALCLLSAALTLAQSKSSDTGTFAPEFEVASIRQDESGSTMQRVMMLFEPDEFTGTHVTLKMLIAMAYGIDDGQIIGAPAWISSDEYEIQARIDSITADHLSKLNDDQRKLAQQHMFQALLSDRFKLALHREAKEMPIYSLVIAKHGSKLHDANPDDAYVNGVRGPDGDAMGPGIVSYSMRIGYVQMIGQAAPLGVLLWRLSQKAEELDLGRKIVDNTGLTGKYDFKLDFKVPYPRGAGQTPMFGETDGGKQEMDSGTAAETSQSSLFNAIQDQLGLKLEPTTGPVETVTIDHVEKPSEN
jgi:uncharacterized protein (TIGR03435 family)